MMVWLGSRLTAHQTVHEPHNSERMEIQLDTLYNMDCLEGMKHIPDGSVDAIICDLPYGTMKGAMKWEAMGWEGNKHDWDDIIPSEPLFEQYERVLRRGGVAVLFSQEPYTSHLRTFRPRNMSFCYPMIWKKDSAGNALNAKNAPLGYFEDINVFTKDHDSQLLHPLREYFSKVMDYIGATSCKQINEQLGHRRAEHTFYVSPRKKNFEEIGGKADHTFRNGSSQFALCTPETYQELIDKFHIDQMPGFRTYDSLFEEDKRYQRTFNLPDGFQSMSNVLEFRKDTDTFHPTQKPVALMQRLVLTYTNPGDTVLDNCMGSGTTAVACLREKRHFIGFEMNTEYYTKALQRIDIERRTPSLF